MYTRNERQICCDRFRAGPFFLCTVLLLFTCSLCFFFFFGSNVLCLKDLITCDIANSPCSECFLPEPWPLMVLLGAWPAAGEGAAVGKEAKEGHGAGAKLWMSALLCALRPPPAVCWSPQSCASVTNTFIMLHYSRRPRDKWDAWVQENEISI